MSDVKPFSSPLAIHFRLSSNKCPKSDEDKIKDIPYAFAVWSLMYSMMCTQLDIAMMGITRKSLANLFNKHCAAMKWILQYLKGSS